MKSRLTAFLLVLVMLVSMFTLTSCGDETTDLDENIMEPMTITLYSIKGEGTSDEAVAAVEKALNRITRNLYNTNLKLVLFSEAEYDAKLALQLQKAQNAASQNNTGRPPVSDNKDKVYETIVVDGFEEYVYPTVGENQLDIFLVRGKDMFTELANGNALTALGSFLDNKYSNIKTYVNTSYMNAAKVNGNYYAIPNNHLMGSATYLLLNREVMDSLGYTPDTMTSLGALQGYLQAIKQSSEFASYAPLLNCAEPSVAYLQNGSMIGSVLTSDRTAAASVPTLLLNNAEYVDYLASKQAYEKMGYLTYGAFEENTLCGATFISGIPGAVEADYADKYYTVRFSEYTAEQSELYSSMYVVSKHTVNAERCIQILSLLTLDTEFRNIFQYGVENTHYSVDNTTNILTMETDKYNMNPLYTGNEFLLYHASTMTDGYEMLRQELTYAQTKAILGDLCIDDEWSGTHDYAIAKCLNNAVRFNPYEGFRLNQADKDNLALVNAKTDAYLAEADAIDATGLTLSQYIEAIKAFYQAKALELNADTALIALVSTDDATSTASRYLSWAN